MKGAEAAAEYTKNLGAKEARDLEPPLNALVMLARSPLRRLVSAFDDAFHADGLSFENKRLLNKRLATSPPLSLACFGCSPEEHNQTRDAFLNTTMQRLAIFATNPGVADCQTKMLTGARCADGLGVDSDRRALAVSRVRAMAFVGLTGHWDATMCLWCARPPRCDAPRARACALRRTKTHLPCAGTK